MKRHELDLYLAIHDVYGRVGNPRSDKWLTKDLSPLCRMVQEQLEPDPRFMQEVAAAWSAYGKSGAIDEAGKRLKLLCEVALAHGRECFWKNRNKGDCSDDVTLGRLDHNQPHTLENCVIECLRHNTMRQDKSVDEFLPAAG